MGEARKLVRFLVPGSFNPITIAHLRMIELARDFVHKQNWQFEKAIISPVGDGYGEKKGILLSADLRVEMCRKAVTGMDWIMIDDYESKLPQWLRTLESLQRQQEIADQADGAPRVMLLCGADLITSFSKPGLWNQADIQAIMRDYGILVITRTGAESFMDHIPDDCLSKSTGVHRIEEWVPNEISSTKIRYGLRMGLSVRHLVPDPVLEYIKERKLYETEPK